MTEQGSWAYNHLTEPEEKIQITGIMHTSLEKIRLYELNLDIPKLFFFSDDGDTASSMI